MTERPELSDELRKRLVSDLQKSGFASEMQTLTRLSRLGWDAYGGYPYFDFEGHKTRSIDVQAYKHLSFPREDDLGGPIVEVNLSAEVKKSESPWIVFVDDAHGEHNESAWPLLDGHSLPQPAKEYRLEWRDPLNEAGHPFGYAVHEAFKQPTESSRWFGAAHSAITAAEASHRYEIEMWDRDGQPTDEGLWYLDFRLHWEQPVVILDGSLIVARLVDAELELSTTDMVCMRVANADERAPRHLYHVHLVSLSAIDRYSDLLVQRLRALQTKVVADGGYTDQMPTFPIYDSTTPVAPPRSHLPRTKPIKRTSKKAKKK